MSSATSSTPLVSIIMPAYNAQGTLAAAVESAVSQTWMNWELILIVDLHSKDGTAAMAQSFAAREPRIRLLSDLPQGGCTFNRNEGLRQSRGDYVAFLDSDDLWLPQKLEKQVAFMQEMNAALSCTAYKCMDWQGKDLATVVTPPPRANYASLLRDNTIGCLTAMIDRRRFPDIQFVDHLHEDYILWLQLLKQTDALGLQEVLAAYRMAPHSRSGNKKRAAIARWRILRNYEHLPLWRALPCFMAYAARALRRRSM